MPIRRSGIASAFTSSAAAEPQTGLTLPGNNAANSDIRIIFSGANLLPRTAHTFVWKSNYTQQAGYYASTWHSHNDGTFHGDTYEFGCHPYPTDSGSVDGNGQQTDPSGDIGTIHYHEIAGLGAQDYLSSPGGANGGAKLVTKGVWRWYARVCFVAGSDLIHRHYRNLESDLTDYIEQSITTASLTTPSAPAFYFGCSDWKSGVVGAGTNNENPCGHHRGFAAFSAALTASECQQELASDSNSPQTAAGAASVWYINKNPTPSDVSDKSGAGHSPSWPNAVRPTLWTP